MKKNVMYLLLMLFVFWGSCVAFAEVSQGGLHGKKCVLLSFSDGCDPGALLSGYQTYGYQDRGRAGYTVFFERRDL